jgi:hypothetical protein
MQKTTSRIHTRSAAVRRLALTAVCLVALASATACAKAKAADLVPDGPPLAMSSPPPRVITPVDDGAVVSPSPPNPQPAAAAPAGAAASRPPRAQPRPGPGPGAGAEPPAPVAAVQPAPPPAVTPTPLEVRSVPSTAAAGEEKKVREVMQRASNDLNRVNYQRLSAEGKAQYQQSQRFSEQADQALKEKNFVYAMTLAEKAATFAAELAGR